MKSCSEFISEHRQEGFQSVREFRMCQFTKENSQQLEREKLDHIKFSNDNRQFSKESQVIKRRNTVVINVNATVQGT